MSLETSTLIPFRNRVLTNSEFSVISEQGKTILIVEDDDAIRESLQSVLTAEGYDAYSAKNGYDALVKLHHIPKPSLILLDLMMPIMNGYEFMEQLKNEDLLSTIPVIVVTAKGQGRVGDVDVKEVFHKPYDLERLLPRIQHHFIRGAFSETEDEDYEKGA